MREHDCKLLILAVLITVTNASGVNTTDNYNSLKSIKEDISKATNYSSILSDTTNTAFEVDQKFNSAILHRVARSSTNCVISEDQLIELKTKIEKILADTKQFQNSNCNLNENSNRCDELINFSQCGISHLSSEFSKVIQSLVTFDGANKWIHGFYNSPDNVKNETSWKYQQDLNDLKEKLNGRQNELKNEVDNLNTKTIELSINELNDKLFKISEIIQSGDYGNKKITQLQNILHFIQNLKNFQLQKDVFEIMFESLKSSNELYKLEPVLSQTNEASIEFIKHEEMVEILKSFIRIWKYKARKGYSEEIRNFSTNHFEAFGAVVGQLVVEAYGENLENAEQIIEFIRELPYINDLIIGYDSLYKQMEKNYHLDSYQLVMLAYRIKETMEMDNYPNMGQDLKVIFNNLYNKLPDALRRLIWNGDVCTIRNRKHNEYLYESNIYSKPFFFTTDETRLHVFTWIGGGGVAENKGSWKFSPVQNGKYFTILNRQLSHYLFSSKHNFDKDRRRVFTWTAGNRVSNGDWKIAPVESGSYFTLTNDHHGQIEYLFADGYFKHDSERREVFTWIDGKPIGDMVQESHWEINC